MKKRAERRKRSGGDAGGGNPNLMRSSDHVR